MIELFAVALAVLVLDHSTKRLVEIRLPERCLSLGPLMRIRCVSSRRTHYERDGTRALLVLVWLVALGSAVILHRSGARFQTQPALYGLGSALGGAAGNLSDILRRRGVTDFIDFGWWPAFNLADAAILAGLAVAFWPAA